jgi:hypothetical protein
VFGKSEQYLVVNRLSIESVDDKLGGVFFRLELDLRTIGVSCDCQISQGTALNSVWQRDASETLRVYTLFRLL